MSLFSRSFTRLGASLAAAGVLGLAGATAAGAAPLYSVHEFQQFPIPASFSCEVIVDHNGNLWSDQFTGNAMGEVDPATGAVSEVPLPNPGGAPGGQNLGPDGDIWFVEAGGNALGRLNVDTKTIQTIPFPWANAEATVGLPVTGSLLINNGLGVPFDDTWGADGKLYIALVGLNAIGSYDPTNGQWGFYPIPTPLSGPIAMERGPNDTVAIAEGTADKIALFNTTSHTYTEYNIPTPASLPGGLTESPDGKYLYFGETLGQKIGRLDPSTGQIKEYPLPPNVSLGDPVTAPGQLRFGSDGMLYIMQGTFDAGDTIGQLDVNTGAYRSFATPTPLSSPCDLNNTIDGKILFGEFTGNRIGWLDIPKGNGQGIDIPPYNNPTPDTFPAGS